MRGKLGLIVGLGVGYVLGTRAGRARYEQIAEAASTVWHLEPVQKQVTKVTDFAKSSVAALPRTLWNTAVKIQKASSTPGTVSDRVARGTAVAQDSVPGIKRAADISSDAVEDIVEDAADNVAAKLNRRTPKKR